MIDLTLFLFRIISQFELTEGNFVSQEIILSHAASCGLQCCESFLGRVISSVWNGKVVRSRFERGYSNLKLLKASDGDCELIERLDDSVVNKLQTICSKTQNWVLNCSVGKQEISIVKIPDIPVNVESRPIACEVSCSLIEPISGITVRTHGDAVIFHEIATQLGQLSTSVKDIETVIRVIDAASLCMGNVVIEEQCQGEDYLHSSVLGSKMVTVLFNQSKMEKRLVSTSCMLTRFGTKACEKCQYVFRLGNDLSFLFLASFY